MRVLTFTRLWPSSVHPQHGVFVEERMRRYAALPGCSVEVIAPVPWFPRMPGPARWTAYAGVPHEETRYGIRAHHPRYVVLPKIGPRHQGASLLAATASLAERLHRENPFDLVDGHYLWPDGHAAASIARRLGLPVVLSARGSDAFSMPENGVRAGIERAIAAATMLIAVSRPIADRLVELGADPRLVVWVANGVDATTFSFDAAGRDAVRERLGVREDEKLVLSVGRLEPVKGHEILLDAVARLGRRDVRLVIAGDGSLRERLESRARDLGVRLTLEGVVAHESLRAWYSAADLFCLPSLNEGHPNALVESLACGTPAVATSVGAAPDLVSRHAGVLVPGGDAAALAAGLSRALASSWDREGVRACVTGRSWDAVAREVHEVFREALLRHAHAQSASEISIEAS